MFPVTITLQDAAQLNAVMAALNPTTASAKVEAPKPTKVDKPAATQPAAETKAAKSETATAAPSSPKPAAAATAPAPAAAQTASSDAAMSEADLTKVVVAAVARVGKDNVLAVLQEKFNVTAGKQITDPAVRAQAKAELEAL